MRTRRNGLAWMMATVFVDRATQMVFRPDAMTMVACYGPNGRASRGHQRTATAMLTGQFRTKNLSVCLDTYAQCEDTKGMTEIREIRPQVYAIVFDGHALRQHYFTKQSAQIAAMQLRATR